MEHGVHMSGPSFNFEVVYFIPKWGDHQRGYVFDLLPSGFYNRRQYNNLSELTQMSNRLAVPMDPLTTIAMGLVTPEELNIPPGLQAAFNLLK